MLKSIIALAIASMLFTLPIAFFVSQTAEGGNGNVITVSQELTMENNVVTNGNIAQVSIVETGTEEPGDSSGGGSDDGSGSGDGSGNGNGGGSDGGSDDSHSGDGGKTPGGIPEGGSGGNNGGGSGRAETTIASQPSEDLTGQIVINEIQPHPEDVTECGTESIELYNKGERTVNVDHWYMKNEKGEIVGTIHNKEIAPSGFLVVEVNGPIEDGQEITLFNSRDKKVDSVKYIGARSHNSLSYARIFDGLDTWDWVTGTLGFSNLYGYFR